MFRVLVILFLLIGFSCAEEKPPATTSSTNAFYYWQTSLNSFHWSDSLFRKMNVTRVYYRFFDVDWSEEANAPVPVSPLDLYYSYNRHLPTEIVPVVFITNETFKKLSVEQSTSLARQVHRKVMTKLNSMLRSQVDYDMYGAWWWEQDPYQVKSKNFDEQAKHDSLYAARMKRVTQIQFDCDWTKSTKDKYFAFLEESVKVFTGQQVSSTVRLYQYKYPQEAGLPPVNRGMLMCYNAGDIRDVQTENSIFDKKEIMSYLNTSEYPIPLDYALPVFEWALLFRDGKLKNILSSSIVQEYQQQVLRRADHLEVIEDFVYGSTVNSILIRKGDEIRLEDPDRNDVKEVSAWLAQHKNNKEAVLTLYHLNDYDLKKHSKEIEAVFNSF